MEKSKGQISKHHLSEGPYSKYFRLKNNYVKTLCIKFYRYTLHNHRNIKGFKILSPLKKSLKTDFFVQTKCNNELP